MQYNRNRTTANNYIIDTPEHQPVNIAVARIFEVITDVKIFVALLLSSKYSLYRFISEIKLLPQNAPCQRNMNK